MRAKRRAALLRFFILAPVVAGLGTADRVGDAAPPNATARLVAFYSHPKDPLAGRTVGELAAVAPPDSRGYMEIVLRDQTGTEHPIAWRGVLRRPCLAVGRTYDVLVELESGPVPASSLVIRDKQGLVYAAASDAAPGQTVLRKGLDDFRVAAAPGRLSVRLGESSVDLAPGQSARMAGYEVVCLAAGSPGAGPVSWVITRSPETEGRESLAQNRTATRAEE